MIEELEKNINTEIEMLRELSILMDQKESALKKEKKLIDETINLLSKNIKLINDSIPALLKSITLAKKLPTSKKTKLEKIEYKSKDKDIDVAIQIKDREKFLEGLSITESLLKKLKREKNSKKEEYQEFKAARGYLKLSNKLFLNFSNSLLKKGYFKRISIEIKKANLDILPSTYVSMILLTTAISIFAGILFTIILLFFNIGLDPPFFSLFSGNYALRFVKTFWIIFAAPMITFFALFFYPSTEKSSISKKIENELPFAVIHMSAISGSGIEPSQIFRIIGLSREYPNLRREFRKVLNQINIYGYDLVSALRNISESTPSKKMAELLNGLATTISTGGDLKSYFEKRAESLLLSYRVEREKFSKIAETFMDVYISVVIAAPMILMLILVLITVSGIQIGFGIGQLSFLIVAVVALVNIVFLAFLQVKQPGF